MSLRHTFDERLEEVRIGILRMGDLTCDMIRKACEAATSGNLELAQEVVQADNEIDRLEEELVLKTVSIVVLELPVASDLRLLAATLGVVGEIEKAADNAVKLAGRAMRLTARFPGELKAPLAEMGEMARVALASSLRLYAQYDDASADAIIANDEVIDRKYAEARARVVDLLKRNPESADSLVRSLDAIHTMEHVADHAVEIAQRLKLHHTGRHHGPPSK